ncbi:radical SAM protein [bacterium]|nr:radical SAM protein [bacterium]
MQITRVLLISPNRLCEPYPVYPLALSYLKAELEQGLDGILVELFDANTGTEAELDLTLTRFQPGLVGISLRNIDTVNASDDRHFVQECQTLISRIKSRVNAMVVIGGAGFSIFPKVIFEQIQPDYGIFGEGESALRQLIRSLNQGDNVDQIQGLVFSRNGQTFLTPRHSYCKAPEPVFDDALVAHYWQTAGMLNIQTKRGCPYQCSYCTYPLIEGRQVRTQDPVRLVQALKSMHDNQGVDYFFFTDSVFNIDNDFNRKLATEIIAANLNIKWGAYFTPSNLDEAFLSLLQQSGLTHLEFGTESLSNLTLKAYNKTFSVEDVMETAAMVTGMGFHSAHFLILGGLGETIESIEETIRNSNRLEKTIFFPFLGMRIYPQTRLHQVAIEEGVIDADDLILESVFYRMDGLNVEDIRQKTKSTNNRWVFPDEDLQKPMEFMRKRGIKGPLWDFLIK